MRRAVGFSAVVVLVAALLLTWAYGIGRYGGPDEPAHVLRAFAVADGQVIGERTAALASGYRVVSVPERLASGDPACFRHDARSTSACAAASGGDGRVSVATAAGINPPLYYALVGLPVRVLGDPADSAWYRLVASMLVAVVLALAVWRLRPIWRSAPFVLAVVAPSSWFLFGVVNPNGLELALAALSWVGVARWLRSPAPSAAEAAWVAVPVAVAIAIRPVALMALLAVLAVVEIGRRPSGRHRLVLWAPALGAGATVAVWNRLVGLEVDDPRTAHPGPLGDALVESLRSTPATLRELVGSLGWLEFSAPAGAQLLWCTALAGAVLTPVVMARRRATSRTIAMPSMPAIIGAWAGVLLLTPVLFEVALRERIGPIWQGRYSLPTFLGLGALIAARARPPERLVAASLTIVAAIVEVWTYWATVRRYAVGSHGSWWLSGGIESSTGFAPRVWLVVHLVAVAALTGAALLSRRSLDVTEDVDDHISGTDEVEHVETTT